MAWLIVVLLVAAIGAGLTHRARRRCRREGHLPVMVESRQETVNVTTAYAVEHFRCERCGHRWKISTMLHGR